MSVTVGRISMDNQYHAISMLDFRPAVPADADALLATLGIERTTCPDSWPSPIFDVDALHRRNGIATRSR